MTICKLCPEKPKWVPQPLPKPNTGTIEEPFKFGKQVVFQEEIIETFEETLELLSKTKNVK